MQRLNVARAFLKDAPILLMDEPTSALDPATHDAIERELVQAPPDRTVIMIAHRLTYPEMFDKILVLEDGGVAGYGHHDQLKRTCAPYCDLVGTVSQEAVTEAVYDERI
jgi:ABC-type multidrug transport system fused ATPase/permease subunit